MVRSFGDHFGSILKHIVSTGYPFGINGHHLGGSASLVATVSICTNFSAIPLPPWASLHPQRHPFATLGDHFFHFTGVGS